MKFAVLVITTLLMTGCAREAAQAPVAVTEYPVRAVVLGLDAPTLSVTVKHNEIPGFSAAMTTSYTVKDKEQFALLRAGAWINGSVSKDGGKYWIDHIVPESGQK